MPENESRVVQPEPIAVGALVDAAAQNLPSELQDHLPLAESAAAQNMRAVEESSAHELENLSRQLQQAQTPNVPKNAKLIRLRHIAGVWSSLFVTKTACSSGCSHCCHLDVMVPRSEAKLMAKAIGQKLAENVSTFGIEQASEDRRHLGKPCTFLKDSKCSIYDHRPMMCRTLVNMDSVDVLCRLVPDVEVPVPYLNTMKLKGYFVYLTQDEQFADIRDWFPRPDSVQSR